MRHQRELEAKIASTRNGAAIFGLYRRQLERDQALERERIRLDRLVNQLMDESDREREEIARLRQRRREILERLLGFERRAAELRARLETDESVDAWLRELGEERVKASARRLGWVDDGEGSFEVPDFEHGPAHPGRSDPVGQRPGPRR